MNSSGYVKPIILGIISAVLLTTILVCFSFLSFWEGTDGSLPFIPLVAFIILRAIISALQPAPSNFHTSLGQIRFFVAHAHGLATLCFAYSVMEIAIRLSSNVESSIFHSELFIFGSVALLMLLASFVLSDYFSKLDGEEQRVNIKELFFGYALYLGATVLASAYVVATLKSVNGLTVAQMFYLGEEKLPVFVLFGALFFGFIITQGVVNKCVGNLKLVFELCTGLLSSSRRKKYDFIPDNLIFKNFPLFPGAIFSIVFDFAKRSVGTALLYFAAFFMVFVIPLLFTMILFMALQLGATLGEIVAPIIRNPLISIGVFVLLVTVLLIVIVGSALMSIWPDFKKIRESGRADKLIKNVSDSLNFDNAAATLQKLENSQYLSDEQKKELEDLKSKVNRIQGAITTV